MKVEDPKFKKFNHEQAQRMLLVTFMKGLIANTGQQVRFRMPQTLEDAL